MYKNDLIQIAQVLNLPFSGKGKELLCGIIVSHYINDEHDRNNVLEKINKKNKKRPSQSQRRSPSKKKRSKKNPTSHRGPLPMFAKSGSDIVPHAISRPVFNPYIDPLSFHNGHRNHHMASSTSTQFNGMIPAGTSHSSEGLYIDNGSFKGLLTVVSKGKSSRYLI